MRVSVKLIGLLVVLVMVCAMALPLYATGTADSIGRRAYAQTGSPVLIYNADSYPATSLGSSRWAVWGTLGGVMLRSINDDGTLGQVSGLGADRDTPVVTAGDAAFWLVGGAGNWRVNGYDWVRGITFDGLVAYGGARAYLAVVALPASQQYAVAIGSESGGIPRVEFYPYGSNGSGSNRSPKITADASGRSWSATQGVGLTTDGNNVLVVYSVTDSGTQYDVYATLLNSSGGVVSRDIAVGTTTFSDEDPAVVNDGAGYLVAWAYRAGEGTDPCNAASHPSLLDSDGDGMPDAWETYYGLDPHYNDALLDRDGDGLNNVGEWQKGSDPTRADTDGDGLTDNVDPCPTKVDCDHDGLTDYQEVVTYHTNPLLADTDGDGFPDMYEIAYGYDALSASSPISGTTHPALTLDTDGDSMSDAWEIVNGLNPNSPADASLDADGDGVTNAEEAAGGVGVSLIRKRDSDGDGLSDYYEVKYDLCKGGGHTDPMNYDSDGDRFSDGQEIGSVLSQLVIRRLGYDGVASSAATPLRDSQNHIEWPRLSYDAYTGETALVWFERQGLTRTDRDQGSVYLFTLSGSSLTSAPIQIADARNTTGAVYAPPHAVVSDHGTHRILVNRGDGLYLYQRTTTAGTPTPTATATATATSTSLPTATAQPPTATPLAVDAYEPDDTYPTVPIGIPQARTFNPPGDIDRGSFAVKAGYTYRLYTVSQPPLDPRGQVTLQTAGLTYVNDDGGSGKDVLIVFVPLVDDTAKFEIASNNSQYGPNTNYQLTVEEVKPTVIPTATPIPGDAYEPDGSAALAKAIMVGETQTRNIAPATDLDYVRVYLKQDTTYRIFAQRQGSLIDLFLDLDIGLFNDDCPGYGMAASCLEFVSPVSGERILKVGANAGEGGYTLSVGEVIPALTATTLPPTPAPTRTPTPTATPPTASPADAYEPDDTELLSALAVEGAPQSRTFWMSGGQHDVDYARALLKPGTWEIAARSSTSNYDTNLTITFEGRQYTSDDEEGKNAVVVITSTTLAYAVIRVGNMGIDGPGSYTLSVNRLANTVAPAVAGSEDAYEPDSASAPKLYGSEQSRTFNPAGDVDYARYLVKVGVETYFDTLSCQAGADTEIQVYSDGGTLLGQNDDSDGVCSHVSVKRDADTWVTVHVLNRGQAWGSQVSYRLRIATIYQVAPTPTLTPVPTAIPAATLTPVPTVPYVSPSPYPTAVPYPTGAPVVYPTVSSIPAQSVSPTPTGGVVSAASVNLGNSPVAGGLGNSAAALAGTNVGVSLFMDDNNDQLFGLTEAMRRVLVVVRMGAEKWLGYTGADGTLAMRLPFITADTTIQWEVPYLHRSGQLKVSEKTRELPVDLRLASAKYPIYLP
jgi:hypothetical protein